MSIGYIVKEPKVNEKEIEDFSTLVTIRFEALEIVLILQRILYVFVHLLLLNFPIPISFCL